MKAKLTTKWMSRSRKGNEYWAGLNNHAKGWCIFTAPRTLGEGYFIGESGSKCPRRFGPFGSFDAAKAAFEIMGDTLKEK